MPLKKLALSALLLCCFLAASAPEARADNFVVLPGGDLAFNLNGTTQIAFVCNVGCTGSGNSVTFGSGSPNSTTFTFTPAGSAVNMLVGNVSTPLTFLSIETTITGTGFAAAPGPGGHVPSLGSLSITLTQTSPASATRTITPILTGGPGNYVLTFGAPAFMGGAGGTYFTTPTGQNPAGYNYPLIAFSFPSNINLPAGSTTNVTAQVGAIPEPTTMLLFGTGLAGIVGAARRRRKARGGAPE